MIKFHLVKTQELTKLRLIIGTPLTQPKQRDEEEILHSHHTQRTPTRESKIIVSQKLVQ